MARLGFLAAVSMTAVTGSGRERRSGVSPPAAVIGAVGIVYLLTVGRWLTPVRRPQRDLVDAYDLRAYLASFRVLEDSPLAGRSLAASSSPISPRSSGGTLRRCLGPFASR